MPTSAAPMPRGSLPAPSRRSRAPRRPQRSRLLRERLDRRHHFGALRQRALRGNHSYGRRISPVLPGNAVLVPSPNQRPRRGVGIDGIENATERVAEIEVLRIDRPPLSVVAEARVELHRRSAARVLGLYVDTMTPIVRQRVLFRVVAERLEENSEIRRIGAGG